MSQCQCGCGGQTSIAERTNPKYGWVNGQPRRFVRGHGRRGRTAGNPFLVGSYIYIPVNGRSGGKGSVGRVAEHVLKVEKAIGHRLPEGAQVHHVNEVKTDNRTENLVACQDAAYHKLLHLRLAALRACGNPAWRKCWGCQQWDDLSRLYVSPSGREIVHRACKRKHSRAWIEEQKK